MNSEHRGHGGARLGAGRPRKALEDKAPHKYVTIGIGVLPEQAASIRQKAQAAGKSIAHYLADCALNPMPQQGKECPRSVENALRRANRQAECVFLHIISGISKEDVMDAIKGQIKYTQLQKIGIIRGSEIELYTRQDILATSH